MLSAATVALLVCGDTSDLLSPFTASVKAAAQSYPACLAFCQTFPVILSDSGSL